MAASFALRLAPHISFGGLDRPLFKALAGSGDPVAQIDWAAAHGFAGVQDPLAILRPVEEQARIGQALKRHGLAGGCFLYAPPPAWGFLWTSTQADDRTTLAAQVDAAVEAAERIRARHIAVLAPLNPDQAREDAIAAFQENLAYFARQAAAAGVVLCLEAVNSRRVPGMLLNRVLDAHAIVATVAHPGCRLIFDYGHVQAMDGDVIHHLDAVWPEVEVIQIADNPGRVEPGAGELNFERLFGDLVRRGWDGLVELEHGWSSDDAETAQAYLARLRAWCGTNKRA